MSKRPFTKAKKHDSRKRLYGTFDLETDGFSSTVLYATAICEDTVGGEFRPVYSSVSVDGLIDYMVEHNRKNMAWFAHNLEFDARYIMEHIKEHRADEFEKIELRERGMGKIFQLILRWKPEYKRQPLTLSDSMALYPQSLENFAKRFSTDGEKLSHDHSQRFDALDVEHVRYAEQDVICLLSALRGFHSMVLDTFGVNLRYTISSTALLAFQASLEETVCEWRLQEEQEKESRKAYCGGLVFQTDNLQHGETASLDINSAYPYVMRKHGLPMGKGVNTDEYKQGMPGIYHCIVKGKEGIRVAFLHDERGQWRVDTFRSWLTSAEIDYARETGDYEITVKQGFFFPDGVKHICDTFVTQCEQLRRKNAGTPLEIVVKLMQNSVYGKFGTKPEATESIWSPVDPGDEWLPRIAQEIEESIGDTYYREKLIDAPYMLPHWAAFITAHTRIELMRHVKRCENAGFLPYYGDTDSIKVDARAVDIMRPYMTENSGGDLPSWQYGALKSDGNYLMFRPIAPKVYAAFDGVKWSGACKGRPRSVTEERHFRDLYERGDTELARWESPTSFKAYAENGRFSRHQTRKVSSIDNSSRFVVLNDGRVYPSTSSMVRRL